MGGGFWVVAVVGQACVWYNDIEDGFNVSGFESFGWMADYHVSQLKLGECITSYFMGFMRDVGDRD